MFFHIFEEGISSWWKRLIVFLITCIHVLKAGEGFEFLVTHISIYNIEKLSIEMIKKN